MDSENTTGVTSFTHFDRDVAIRYAHKASDLLGADFYYTTEPFTYHIDTYPSIKTVTVPVGFLTDGASIPRIFWFWTSPIGRHAQAAILHDYLCEYLSIDVDGEATPITRQEADRIFKESLLALGVSTPKATLMHLGVSLFRKVFRVSKPSATKEKQDLEDKLREQLITQGYVSGDRIIRKHIGM